MNCKWAENWKKQTTKTTTITLFVWYPALRIFCCHVPFNNNKRDAICILWYRPIFMWYSLHFWKFHQFTLNGKPHSLALRSLSMFGYIALEASTSTAPVSKRLIGLHLAQYVYWHNDTWTTLKQQQQRKQQQQQQSQSHQQQKEWKNRVQKSEKHSTCWVDYTKLIGQYSHENIVFEWAQIVDHISGLIAQINIKYLKNNFCVQCFALNITTLVGLDDSFDSSLFFFVCAVCKWNWNGFDDRLQFIGCCLLAYLIQLICCSL